MRGLMEQRSLIIKLGAVVLSVWTLVAFTVPDILWAGRITFPVWIWVYLMFLADRNLKFRLFYEGIVGSAAYWLLHDLPIMFHLKALQPHTPGQFLVLLTLTGMLAALPFGRRGPAVAGVSGALLALLWLVYAVGRTGRLPHPMTELDNHFLPAVVFMMLGGLLVERLTRRLRGDEGYAGPQGALWAFVAGAAITRLAALW